MESSSHFPKSLRSSASTFLWVTLPRQNRISRLPQSFLRSERISQGKRGQSTASISLGSFRVWRVPGYRSRCRLVRPSVVAPDDGLRVPPGRHVCCHAMSCHREAFGRKGD
ncbi:hypothetical protein AAFF_G00038700 [Aldrovandia affinis]|uniref:Uncharacterized protein n=1 Tax=Aldrovandia affinis TaxID=143900 RepID=A0AAD7T5M0_9TELE|nr:hypothetical protein AAFF_G00038700 [Aldrovandia affinis]